MYDLPKDPKKIRERIRRYERALKKEQQMFGGIHDGAGKRYLLGPLYMLMGDVDGAIKSYQWFEENFSDDIGEPAQYLCWTLALYRSGDLQSAHRRLRQTMLMNLYLIPHFLGKQAEGLDIWHASNWEEADYVEYIPDVLFQLWDAEAIQWLEKCYHGEMFQKIRRKYIAILRQLKSELPGSKRTELVQDASRMEKFDYEVNQDG